MVLISSPRVGAGQIKYEFKLSIFTDFGGILADLT